MEKITWKPSVDETPNEIFEKVFTIISAPGGKTSLKEARKCMSPFLKLYQSDILYPGRIFWTFGVSIVNKRRSRLGLELNVQELELIDDNSIYARAFLQNRDLSVNSEFNVLFRIKNNRVFEIRTKKSNYIPLFGDNFLHPLGILLLFKHII